MSEFREVAKISDMEDGSSKIIQVDGKKIALFRVGEEIFAIDDRCSHAEASLGKGYVDKENCVVSCPLHGAKFDLRTGKNLSLPAVVPVGSHSVKVEDGTIYLAV